jgi:DNA-binding MarR family transcriptional regulator
MREIAERMINRDPDVTRLADRTVALGLVRRKRASDDRRVVKLYLTPKGLDLLARLDDAVADFLRQALGPLGRKRLLALRDLLNDARAGRGPFPATEGAA